MYQGVTLGGTGKEHGKRHPTLGNNVVVGAGAKVLGNIKIGSNTRIGAGSVVLKDVEADCTVVGIPGRIVHQSGVNINPLAHSALPDAEARIIKNLMQRIDQLEGQIRSLEEVNEQYRAKYDKKQEERTKVGEAQSLMDREILEYRDEGRGAKDVE